MAQELHSPTADLRLHDWLASSQGQSYVTTDGLSAIQSCCQAPSGTQGQIFVFLLLSDSCGFLDVERLLWLEDGSVVYNSCWPSPAQSFSGQSPAGLMTIFYCLIFETPSTWRTRSPYSYPPGTAWSTIPQGPVEPRYIASGRTAQKTASNSSPIVAWQHCCRREVTIMPLPSKGWRIWRYGVVWRGESHSCVPVYCAIA
jgi:hypothetical protein